MNSNAKSVYARSGKKDMEATEEEDRSTAWVLKDKIGKARRSPAGAKTCMQNG